MTHKNTRLAALLAAGAMVALGAQAQMFKDAELEALNRNAAIKPSEREAALAKRAQERLAANPKDLQALLALAVGTVNTRDAKQREAALGKLKACTEAQTDAAPCHYGHAALLGSHALQIGVMKALGSASAIREGFARAVELDPLWYPARSGLHQFYLQAPGIVGGSVSKARELGRAVAAQRPEQARVLDALVALHQKDFDAATKLMAAYRPGTDAEVDDDAEQVWRGAGFGLLGDGKPESARAVFERIAREQPGSALGPYGLARVAAEQNRHADALKLLQAATKLEGAESLPMDFRLGLSHAALGQREQARAALQRFVASPAPWPKIQRDEARKKLEELA